jgi:DNA-binding PadR family transcriptional regulator
VYGTRTASSLPTVEPKIRPSPPALAVLCLLQAGPLHPYGMQRLIKLWGKDQVVNVGQRANLYKTIKRLQQAGLISVLQTERDQQYPERTVYELTDEGRLVARAWLVDMLATARHEFPEFPAALSFAMVLTPDEVTIVLTQRAVQVREALARLQSDLDSYLPQLPRVTLLDTEYQRSIAAAELAWIDSVIGDLRSGALTWGHELVEMAMAEMAKAWSTG